MGRHHVPYRDGQMKVGSLPSADQQLCGKFERKNCGPTFAGVKLFEDNALMMVGEEKPVLENPLK